MVYSYFDVINEEGVIVASKQRTALPEKSIKRNWRIALYAVLFLGVFVLCAMYFRLTSTPMAGIDISPSKDPTRWRFSLEDGTTLQPVDGQLLLTGENTVILCQTQLTEALSKQPYFVVTANNADCVIYVNDSLVYAPSGRFEGNRFSAAGYAKAAASGQFIARLTGDVNTLTMRVQFQGEDHLIKHLPRLTVYFDSIAYRSQPTATTAEAAVPAGMFFALALFLSVLFFFGLLKGKRDVGLLLLTACALSMALTSTVSYTVSVAWTLLWASLSIFCSVLPLVTMIWSLWYRLSRRPRMLLLPIVGLVSAVLLYYFVAGFGKSTTLNTQINILQSWVIPGTLLLTIITAAIDAKMGNPWLRRFFKYLVWSIPAVVLAWGFSALTGGKLAQTMVEAVQRVINYHSLFMPCEQLCILLLIIIFFQAVLDLISGLAQRDAELQTLSLREKYAIENMKLMRGTQESTRRERHEMRHHVALIAEMLSSGQKERAQAYTNSLLDKVDALPSDTYSSNPMINAIVGRYLNEAKAEGVAVNADIRCEERVMLRDDELCVLLTNMLENAMEACMKMPEESERFIRFKLRATEDHLIAACENSTDAELMISANENVATSKASAESHGFGIPVMRQIAEKHNGKFSVACAKGVFSVKVIL